MCVPTPSSQQELYNAYVKRSAPTWSFKLGSSMLHNGELSDVSAHFATQNTFLKASFTNTKQLSVSAGLELWRHGSIAHSLIKWRLPPDLYAVALNDQLWRDPLEIAQYVRLVSLIHPNSSEIHLYDHNGVILRTIDLSSSTAQRFAFKSTSKNEPLHSLARSVSGSIPVSEHPELVVHSPSVPNQDLALYGAEHASDLLDAAPVRPLGQLCTDLADYIVQRVADAHASSQEQYPMLMQQIDAICEQLHEMAQSLPSLDGKNLAHNTIQTLQRYRAVINAQGNGSSEYIHNMGEPFISEWYSDAELLSLPASDTPIRFVPDPFTIDGQLSLLTTAKLIQLPSFLTHSRVCGSVHYHMLPADQLAASRNSSKSSPLSKHGDASNPLSATSGSGSNRTARPQAAPISQPQHRLSLACHIHAINDVFHLILGGMPSDELYTARFVCLVTSLLRFIMRPNDPNHPSTTPPPPSSSQATGIYHLDQEDIYGPQSHIAKPEHIIGLQLVLFPSLFPAGFNPYRPQVALPRPIIDPMPHPDSINTTFNKAPNPPSFGSILSSLHSTLGSWYQRRNINAVMEFQYSYVRPFDFSWQQTRQTADDMLQSCKTQCLDAFNALQQVVQGETPLLTPLDHHHHDSDVVPLQTPAIISGPPTETQDSSSNLTATSLRVVGQNAFHRQSLSSTSTANTSSTTSPQGESDPLFSNMAAFRPTKPSEYQPLLISGCNFNTTGIASAYCFADVTPSIQLQLSAQTDISRRPPSNTVIYPLASHPWEFGIGISFTTR